MSVQCSRTQLAAREGVLVVLAMGAISWSSPEATGGDGAAAVAGGGDEGCGGEGGSARQRAQLARHARRTRPLASHCAGLTCLHSTEGKPSPAQFTAPSSKHGGGCGGGGWNGGDGGGDGDDGGDGGGGGEDGGSEGGGDGDGGDGGGGRWHKPQLRRQARPTSALTPHCVLVAALHRLAGNSSDPSQSVAPSSIHGGGGGGGEEGGEGVGLQVNSLQLPLSFALNSYALHHELASPFSQANWQSDARAARGGS
jgi:hypothetical protein